MLRSSVGPLLVPRLGPVSWGGTQVELKVMEGAGAGQAPLKLGAGNSLPGPLWPVTVSTEAPHGWVL